MLWFMVYMQRNTRTLHLIRLIYATPHMQRATILYDMSFSISAQTLNQTGGPRALNPSEKLRICDLPAARSTNGGRFVLPLQSLLQGH